MWKAHGCNVLVSCLALGVAQARPSPCRSARDIDPALTLAQRLVLRNNLLSLRWWSSTVRGPDPQSCCTIGSLERERPNKATEITRSCHWAQPRIQAWNRTIPFSTEWVPRLVASTLSDPEPNAVPCANCQTILPRRATILGMAIMTCQLLREQADGRMCARRTGQGPEVNCGTGAYWPNQSSTGHHHWHW